MARIGGRSLWLAWPAGLVCAGIVGALFWLAAPAVPGTITFVGDTLRASTSTPQAAPPQPLATTAIADDADVDCHDLYPASLWSELVWRQEVILSQNRAAPATAVPTLVGELQPVVRVTCVWRDGRSSIKTTLSLVGTDAASRAAAVLEGRRFSCTPLGTGTVCRRGSGRVLEEHAVRDGLWIATVETAWHPEGYGERLASFVWG
jgi:hypothetical protein